MNARRLWLPGPAALLATAVVAVAVATPLESWDLMFYLATGRWLLENGFPTADPFSPLAASAWFPHCWASCVLSELALRAFGATGPALLFGLVLGAQVLLVGLLLDRAGARGAGWLLLLLLVLAIQAPGFGLERAYHIGRLGLAAALWLLLRWRDGAEWGAWLFAPLTMLWANLHGSWIAAPALLGAAAAGAAIESGRLAPRHLRAGLAAGLAWLAAAVAPAGLANTVYPLRFLWGVSGQGVAEWHAWSLGTQPGRALALLCLLATWTAARSHRRPWSLLLPAAGLLLATVHIERFAALAGMVLAVATAHMLAHGRDTGRERPPAAPGPAAAIGRLHGWIDSWRRGACGPVWPAVLLAAVAVAAALQPAGLIERLSRREFPLPALEALCRQPPGRVLASYRFGAAVSALCGPDYPVFIDGRAANYPPAVHADYRKLALLEPGWRQVLADFDPQAVLWTSRGIDSRLGAVLDAEPGWRRVVRGPVGGLWIRASGDR
jgi:hypothetical protein